MSSLLKKRAEECKFGELVQQYMLKDSNINGNIGNAPSFSASQISTFIVYNQPATNRNSNVGVPPQPKKQAQEYHPKVPEKKPVQ